MDNLLYFIGYNIINSSKLIIMKENILKDKSFFFAIRIVNLYKYLKKEHEEYILSQQLIRSGTSIGQL